MAAASPQSSPVSRSARDYWRQSRRPLASLLFVLPLLAIYEGGVIWLGPDAVRNGADVWLTQLMAPLGLAGMMLVPLTAVFILLAWHHVSGQGWHISALVLYTMLGECAALALLLVGLAHAQANVMALCGIAGPSASVEYAPACAWTSLPIVRDFVAQLVRFFGAGIYEELLFRLLLLPVAIAVLGVLIGSAKVKVLAAVALTSLAFSAAHYIGPHGEQLIAYTFIFRFLAGVFFALLFVHRGFGIAAGTHALYDIFVGFVFP
jgi:membrane protease YdiL (CAAX protease family)